MLRHIAANKTIEDVFLFANNVATLAWRHISPACCRRFCLGHGRGNNNVVHATWLGDDDRDAWSRLNVFVRSRRHAAPVQGPARWESEPVGSTDNRITAATESHRDIRRRYMLCPERTQNSIVFGPPTGADRHTHGVTRRREVPAELAWGTPAGAQAAVQKNKPRAKRLVIRITL